MRTRIDITFEAGTRQINTGITDLQLKDIASICISNKGVIIPVKVSSFSIDSVANGIITYKASYTDDGEVTELPALEAGDLVWVEIDRGAYDNSIDELVSQEELMEYLDELFPEEEPNE